MTTSTIEVGELVSTLSAADVRRHERCRRDIGMSDLIHAADLDSPGMLQGAAAHRGDDPTSNEGVH